MGTITYLLATEIMNITYHGQVIFGILDFYKRIKHQWEILERYQSHVATKKCNLCLNEKLRIAPKNKSCK